MDAVREAFKIAEQFMEEHPEAFNENETRIVTRLSWRLEREMVQSVLNAPNAQADIRRFFQVAV
jgi:hypothetical protein